MAHDEVRSATAVVRVFWSGVVSRAHVVYGASWLRRFTSPVTVTLFPPRGFLNAAPLSAAEITALLPDNVQLEQWSQRRPLEAGQETHFLSVGAVGIKPWLRLRRELGLRRMPVTVTDEGLGSYGNWFTRRAAWQREGVREPWLSIRPTVTLGASQLLTSKRWALHRFVSGQWEVNGQIAAEFKRQAQRETTTRNAVFLSQPWPELGLLSEAAYLEHVHQLAEVCQRAGYNFLVHPHPAEPAGRYPQTTKDAQSPAEFSAQCVNAAVLLGATSTAMLNLAAIHQLPAIRVAPTEVAALDGKLSSRQASLLQHHLGEICNVTDFGTRLVQLQESKTATDRREL